MYPDAVLICLNPMLSPNPSNEVGGSDEIMKRFYTSTSYYHNLERMLCARAFLHAITMVIRMTMS